MRQCTPSRGETNSASHGTAVAYRVSATSALRTKNTPHSLPVIPRKISTTGHSSKYCSTFTFPAGPGVTLPPRVCRAGDAHPIEQRVTTRSSIDSSWRLPLFGCIIWMYQNATFTFYHTVVQYMLPCHTLTHHHAKESSTPYSG